VAIGCQYAELWLDASSTTGIVSDLSLSGDLRDNHADLLAAQGRVNEFLETGPDTLSYIEPSRPSRHTAATRRNAATVRDRVSGGT
jgi:hypothetical protein